MSHDTRSGATLTRSWNNQGEKKSVEEHGEKNLISKAEGVPKAGEKKVFTYSKYTVNLLFSVEELRWEKANKRKGLETEVAEREKQSRWLNTGKQDT